MECDIVTILVASAANTINGGRDLVMERSRAKRWCWTFNRSYRKFGIEARIQPISEATLSANLLSRSAYI